MRPSTRIARPGLMPPIRRRPSQITLIDPVPSYSSASSAGTPPRGRRVTVFKVPCTIDRLAQGRVGDAEQAGLAGVLAQLTRLVPVLVGPAADGLPEPALLLRHGRQGSPAGPSRSVDPTDLRRQPQRQCAPGSASPRVHGVRRCGGSCPPRERRSPASSGRRSDQRRAQQPGRALVPDDPAGLGRALSVGRLRSAPGTPARCRSCPSCSVAVPPIRATSAAIWRPQVVPGVATARGREGTQLERAVLADQDTTAPTSPVASSTWSRSSMPSVRGDDEAAEVDALVRRRGRPRELVEGPDAAGRSGDPARARRTVARLVEASGDSVVRRLRPNLTGPVDRRRSVEPAGRAVAALAAGRLRQVVGLHEGRGLEPLHHQLGDPVTAADGERRRRGRC